MTPSPSLSGFHASARKQLTATAKYSTVGINGNNELLQYFISIVHTRINTIYNESVSMESQHIVSQLVVGHRISWSSSLAIFFCFKYPTVPPMINNRTDTPANPPISLGRVEDCFVEVDASVLGVGVSVLTAEVDVKVTLVVSDGEVVDMADSDVNVDVLENDGDDDSVGIVYVDAEEETSVVTPESDEDETEVEGGF